MPLPVIEVFRVRRADWQRDAAILSALRNAVFVREQGVPKGLEFDGQDAQALHLLAEAADGTALGTARLLPDGQIGRMAVLAPWRRQGVGRALLLELLRIATDTRLPTPHLHAQEAVIGFYAAHGFVASGAGFTEAGIAHRRMHLADPGLALAADITRRRLGHSGGLLALPTPDATRAALRHLAEQARRQLAILTPDLEPCLYDQPALLAALRRLAVQRRGRVVVRILLLDPLPALRRGHRLLALARRLPSAILIRDLPEDLANTLDPCLIADDQGYCQRRLQHPGRSAVDFAAPADCRRLLRAFNAIWEQAGEHIELRRLDL